LASGGQAVKFAANAINDALQTVVNVPVEGNYNVTLRGKVFTDRGAAALYINGVLIGSWDQYASSAFADKDFGPVILKTSNTFKWVITGKNASSRTFDFTMDKLTLTPRL
jgi:hypothetical protein